MNVSPSAISACEGCRGSRPQGGQLNATVSSMMCDVRSENRPYYRPHQDKDSSESHASCWIVMVYHKI